MGERRYWELRGISELVAADGSVLGTREWAGFGGRWLKVVIKVQDRTYRWQRLGHKIPGRQFSGVSELVAVEGEESVLRTEGLHFSYKAGTRVTLSDQRSFALSRLRSEPEHRRYVCGRRLWSHTSSLQIGSQSGVRRSRAQSSRDRDS